MFLHSRAIRDVINLFLAIVQLFFFPSSSIIIILFWEINVLGQSIIQPGEGGKSDVNSLPKINCSVGKGSQPLLACLRAIPSTH